MPLVPNKLEDWIVISNIWNEGVLTIAIIISMFLNNMRAGWEKTGRCFLLLKQDRNECRYKTTSKMQIR